MTAVESAAALLQRCRKVVVLSGAGMSTAAGIPDFRSPGGLYGNAAILLDRFTFFDSSKSAAWQRNMLEEDVRSALTLEFFSRNPLPYHEMRRGFIIGLGEGQWKLTLAHLLPELLNRNGKLELLASQNIDGLDHKVVSDKSKLYNPHGLMSTLVCEEPGSTRFLCTSPDHPLYQRYVELIKQRTKDIYAERTPREGKSCHRHPGPAASSPITLADFGELLPPELAAAREREHARQTFSVKPGSVLFDRTLWTANAAGEPCNAFEAAESCDLVLVMGTSLSGLTIDHVAHHAGRSGTPRLVFDMSTAPVDSLRANAGWKEGHDVFLHGALDTSVLQLVQQMGWLGQLYDRDYLGHLCLGSLRALRAFVESQPAADERAAQLVATDAAIEQEVRREAQFYAE